MTGPQHPDGLSLERRRDGQQWILDLMIKQTGREQNWEPDGRRFPPEVKSHDMIPRVMHRRGQHKEQLARAAERVGHRETAVALYYEAVEDYRLAQHAIYVDDDREKIYIHGRMESCYDRIIELSTDRIERVDVDFDGQTLSGLLHLAPGEGQRPCVLFCPGMDMTKEAFPTPGRNPYAKRGMHLLAIDGPGQGVSNLRKIRVTDDNYEAAGQKFIDLLVARPEVDASKIGVSGRSMGSFWGMRIAAVDDRVAAIATSVANYATKVSIFQRSSPRFKQVFMYMAGIHDEAAFDEMAARMTLDNWAERITCPTLMVTGEYDPLSPLDQAYRVYEKVAGPKEMWVVEDAFHPLNDEEHFALINPDTFLADWLRDAFEGKAPREPDRKVLIRARSGEGPYGDPVAGFFLPERAES